MSKKEAMEKNESHILAIARGGVLALVGRIMNGGLKYLFDIIIAVFLGSEVGGIYFLSASIVLIVKSIALFGLPVALIRFTAVFKGKEDEARIKGSLFSSLILGITISAGITIFLFLISDPLAYNIFHKPAVGSIIKFLSLSIPFTTISFILTSATRAFKGVKYEVYTLHLSEPLMKIFLALLFFLNGLGLRGAIIAYIASSIFGSFLSIYFARKTFSWWRKETAAIYQFKQIIKFAFPALIISFLSILLVRTDILVLGYLSSAKEVGIYNIAAKLAFIISLVFISFNSIFSPIISELYSKKEQNKLNELFKVQSRWIFTFSLPVALLLMLFASPILNLIGKEFAKGSICLIILSASMAITSSIASVEIMLVFSGRVYLNMLNSIILCVINVILNFLLIPPFGIIGAALATAISLAGINFVRLAQVLSRLRLNPLSSSLLRPFVSASISFLFLFLIRRMASSESFGWIIAQTFISLSIYAMVLYLIGLEKEDILVMKQLMRKLRSYNSQG